MARAPLSPTDARTVARLVAKYGRRAIVAAANTIPMPARAGRRRNDAERAELLDDLEWIERHAELYRDRGDRTALQTAVAERFFARYGRQPGDAFTRYEKRIKNLRDEHARAQRVQNAARTRKRL